MITTDEVAVQQRSLPKTLFRLGDLIERTPDQVEIWRATTITSSALIGDIWQMYDEIFAPVNAKTPIRQSYRKHEFTEFMRREDVIKIIASQNNLPIGIAMTTANLGLDPWISTEYFQEEFFRERSRGQVYYILAWGVKSAHRGWFGVASSILVHLINGLPEDTYGVFDISKKINEMIPRLAEQAHRGIRGELLEEKAIYAYHFRSRE